MKIIEAPAFQLENKVNFDTLVEQEMKSLLGGDPTCGSGAGQTVCPSKSGEITTTTDIPTTTVFIP